MKTLTVNSWRTPLTGLKLSRGAARLQKGTYHGVYPMEGVLGYEYCNVVRPITVMGLQRKERGRWRTWMVDDPLHWTAMRQVVLRLPKKCNLLVAGLGMGLFAHHLANDRPDISKVTVVEIDADVIAMITPTLPPRFEFCLLHADFYDYITRREAQEHSAVLWDLAVGHKDKTRREALVGYALVSAYLPQAELFQFGLRETAKNIVTKGAQV